MEDLAKGIRAIVIFPDTEEEIERSLVSYRVEMDNAYWERFTQEWRGWAGFRHWWIARRWIMPSDPRKWETLERQML